MVVLVVVEEELMVLQTDQVEVEILHLQHLLKMMVVMEEKLVELSEPVVVAVELALLVRFSIPTSRWSWWSWNCKFYNRIISDRSWWRRCWWKHRQFWRYWWCRRFRGWRCWWCLAPGDGSAATANTGSGGGGGGSNNPGSTRGDGANGAGGVVIISVPTSNYSGTTSGSPTVTTSGSNTIITFTGNGSYTT